MPSSSSPRRRGKKRGKEGGGGSKNLKLVLPTPLGAREKEGKGHALLVADIHGNSRSIG